MYDFVKISRDFTQVAKKYDLVIIEDDPYYYLQFGVSVHVTLFLWWNIFDKNRP